MKREGPAEFGDPINGSCEYSTPKKCFKESLACTNKICFRQQSCFHCFPNLGATKNSKFMFDASWNPNYSENPDSEAGSSVIQSYKNLSGTKAQVIDQVMSPGRSCLQSRAHQTRCLQGAQKHRCTHEILVLLLDEVSRLDKDKIRPRNPTQARFLQFVTTCCGPQSLP